MRLDGKNFVVTGAGRGIGSATAEILAEAGASVALLSRSLDVLKQTENNLRQKFPQQQFQSLVVDVGDERQVQNAFQILLKDWKLFHGLINNAAIFSSAPLEEASLAEFRDLLRVNVEGVFLCAREFVRQWKPAPAKGDGVMINISSIAGIEGSDKIPGFSLYSATKAAVVGLSETWAAELAPKGIRVNVVAPGATDTDMLHKALPDFKANLTPRDIAEKILELVLDSNARNKIVVVPS